MIRRLAYHTNEETKEWIDDRVDTLIDNNPDMDESMAYGIAWKCYKKDHPNWQPKNKKSRLKGK